MFSFQIRSDRPPGGGSENGTDNYDKLGIEDDRPVRYWVVCARCGRRIPRMKRSPLVDHPALVGQHLEDGLLPALLRQLGGQLDGIAALPADTAAEPGPGPAVQPDLGADVPGVVCARCGRRIPRMKRSPLVDHPERYRCACGGTLAVEGACPQAENGKM